MKKIAITGASNKDRLILCNALSYLTNYDVIRSIPYTGYILNRGLSIDQDRYEWHELYAYALQSFIERIEVESSCEEFISNGSVFNELAYMKAKESTGKKKNRRKDYSFMNNSLKSIITEYAIKKYDCIIHIAYSHQEVNGDYPLIDEWLRKLIENCDIKYYVHKENSFSEILEQFFADMNLNTKISPSTAIKKAEMELFVAPTK